VIHEKPYLYLLKSFSDKADTFMFNKKVALGIFLTFFSLGFCSISTAQSIGDPVVSNKTSKIAVPVKKIKPLSKEVSGAFRLNSDGWAVAFEKGRIKSKEPKKSDMFHDVRFWQIEFSERRNPKELRMYANDASTSGGKAYAYGKINNLYALRFNIGKKKMIAGKPYPNSISIHWLYAGGLTLGLLKPYYIITADKGSIKYSAENQASFLNVNNIVGAAGFSTGLSETKIIPGLNLKTALHFDFGANKNLLSAVELGVSGEFYTQNIELMANQKAVPYFFNLYAGIQFGRRSR
jgi:hypothetical protein